MPEVKSCECDCECEREQTNERENEEKTLYLSKQWDMNRTYKPTQRNKNKQNSDDNHVLYTNK